MKKWKIEFVEQICKVLIHDQNTKVKIQEAIIQLKTLEATNHESPTKECWEKTTLHLKIMETTLIKISTHSYKYIKRTSFHLWIDWQGEIGPLHQLEWGALSPSHSIFAEWIWHVMKSVWKMMEMLYKYFGDIIGTWEHGKPYENMRKEKKRVDDDW